MSLKKGFILFLSRKCREKVCEIILGILFLYMVLGINPNPCYPSGLDIWCTSPWISLMADFIGGIHISVHSIENWDETGEKVNLRIVANEEIPQGAMILALDRVQAEKLGISNDNFPNLKTLYTRIPVRSEMLRSLYYDPSTLPFLAQRVMNVLSGYDPVHYSYFQRRLAEFQTRLDSTVLVGRKLLTGTDVISIGMDVSQLMVAAGCNIQPLPADLIPPPPLESKDKKKNKQQSDDFDQAMDKLIRYLQEERQKGSITVMDPWTPLYLRERLLEIKTVIMLPRPSLEAEYILFLNDHYLALWNGLRLLNNSNEENAQKRS